MTTKDEQNQPEKVTVSEQELADALSISAVYCQRVIATNTQAGVRLAFGEVAPGPLTHFRSCVFLPYADAFALKDLLERQLSQVQEIKVEDLPDGVKK